MLNRDAAVNPAFAGANHVLAHYCSSDMWSGNTTDKRAFGWYFSGHPNVRAMFELLAERYGLNDGEAEVLFGGGSAGAFGAHFNTHVAERVLPRTAAAKRLRIFVDAGWMTDWDDPAHRLGAAKVRDLEVWRAARATWGATFDPACEAAEKEPVTCFFGPVWYRHLAKRLPVLVQQSSIDTSFMNVHRLAEADSAAASWRAQVDASLADVAWLFNGGVAYHVLGTTDVGLRRGPASDTLAEVLLRFSTDAPPERVRF